MSKEFKDIDDLFKSTIGLGSATAPNHIKTNVMSSVGGANWWVAGAGILLVSSAIGLFAVFNTTDIQSSSYSTRTYAEAVSIEAYTTPIIETKSAELSKKTTPYFHKTSATTPALKTPLTHATPIHSTPSKPTIKAKRKKPLKPISINSQSNGKSTIQEKPVDAPQNQASNTVIPGQNDPVKNTSSTIPTQLANKPDKITIPNSAVIKTSTLPDNSIIPTHIDTKVEPSPDHTIATNNTQIHHTETPEQTEPTPAQTDKNNTNETDHTDTSLVKSDLANVSIPEPNQNDIEIDTDLSPKKGYLTLGISGGPSINTAVYTNSEFGSALSKQHHEQLGYFGQIYGQYVTQNNFSGLLGLGIESQAYSTTFLTSDTIFKYNHSTEFSHYVYDTANTIIDSVFVNTVDTISTTQQNNYFGSTSVRFIQIPIRIGYQMDKNKWLFGFDLGVQLYYLMKSSGNYINNNTVLPIENSGILKRTTLNYSVGGSVQYNLFRQFYLSGHTRFTPPLQNYYQSDYGKRYVNSLSFGMGMSIKL